MSLLRARYNGLSGPLRARQYNGPVPARQFLPV